MSAIAPFASDVVAPAYSALTEGHSLLAQLPRGGIAVVRCVLEKAGQEVLCARLAALGFVPGERVRLLGRGPFGAEPLLVQLGHTRFALRRHEAERVLVQSAAG